MSNIATGTGQAWYAIGGNAEGGVSWTNADGSQSSASANDPAVAAWLAGGGTPSAATLTLAQQAAAALTAGLSITLTGSITLAATVFPTNPTALLKLTQVGVVTANIGAFPGGVSTWAIQDSAGAWHAVNLSQWKTIAAAIGAYAAALDLIIDGNPLGEGMPSNFVSLAV